MGKWSPYNDEWEQQRIRKVIKENEAIRQEFEKKSILYKTTFRFCGTVKYYLSFFSIHFRMLVDREYRKKKKQLTDNEENIISVIVDMAKENDEDSL